MNLATRDGFGDALIQNPHNIFVIGADLAKATKTDKFKELYPKQYLDVGIAEANMVGIASGMSEYGLRVVISSFASFLTGRYDIIRCSLSYPNNPTLIVGTHAGMAIGKDGVTQMGLEDISLMRSLPNMSIYQPSTYKQAVYWTKYLLQHNILAYLRLGRQPVIEMYNKDNFNNYEKIISGNKKVIIQSGCLLEQCQTVAKQLQLDLIDVCRIKPLNIDLSMYDQVFTVEDHSVIGGLGDAIKECHNNVIKIGVHGFPESGNPNDLYKKYKLDTLGILEQVQLYV